MFLWNAEVFFFFGTIRLFDASVFSGMLHSWLFLLYKISEYIRVNSQNLIIYKQNITIVSCFSPNIKLVTDILCLRKLSAST